MLDLKAKLLKIISVCIQDFLLLHVQGDNKWRCQILRIYGMLPELSDQTLIVDFFMRSMLIDDIKFILKLCQPVGVKHLTDHADAASGLRREQLLLKKLKLLRFRFIYFLFCLFRLSFFYF